MRNCHDWKVYSTTVIYCFPKRPPRCSLYQLIALAPAIFCYFCIADLLLFSLTAIPRRPRRPIRTAPTCCLLLQDHIYHLTFRNVAHCFAGGERCASWMAIVVKISHHSTKCTDNSLNKPPRMNLIWFQGWWCCWNILFTDTFAKSNTSLKQCVYHH